MTPNPTATALFDFIRAHALPLRAVARLAHISDTAIRLFRDTPGRTLNRDTRIAIAKALHVLTQESVDLAALFPCEGDGAYQESINVDRNPRFSAILALKGLTPSALSKQSGVKIDTIINLLLNKTIDEDRAGKLARYLGVDPTQIGIGGKDGFDLADIEHTSCRSVGTEEELEGAVAYKRGLEAKHETAVHAAATWWGDLVGMLNDGNRTAIGRHLSAGIPAFYLNDGQLVVVEAAIRYFRDGKDWRQRPEEQGMELP